MVKLSVQEVIRKLKEKGITIRGDILHIPKNMAVGLKLWKYIDFVIIKKGLILTHKEK